MRFLHWLTIAFSIAVFFIPSADGRVTREPSVGTTTDPGWKELDETEYDYDYDYESEYETDVMADQVYWELDNCASNPCRNGGNCTSLPDRPNAYRCTCREGYIGHDCTINVNECDELNGKPNPCQHGKCVDQYGGYKCTCDDGWTGKHCSDLYIPCHPSPCQNGGRCDQIGAYGYQCHCPSGFEGRDCQVNRDDCQGHLCQHGGKCLDGVNTYSCDCPVNWTGEYCGQDVDECATSRPCQNHATCQNTEGGYECICVNGFEGVNCELNSDDICTTDNPCQNQATCHSDTSGYTCMCPDGFEGRNCEHVIDHCISSPCENNGICFKFINDYKCVCQNGFIGRNCEENYNECANSPCQNGGTCHDRVGHYECECPPGKTGLHCHLEDECATSQPCQNHATCQNTEGGYECICVNGFEGVNCELNSDECANSPCQNGICHDKVGSYECECPPGMAGLHCHLEDECARDPCNVGARCDTDKVSGKAVCSCPSGYTGATCDQDINECRAGGAPCEHGGKCVNTPGSFRCDCQTGYTGPRCEANLPKLPEGTQDIQPLVIGKTGQADLPTLPEAIQLFQLESMNKLRQTIHNQEGVITEKQTRIEELEGALAEKDLLIVSMTAEGRKEKEQWETEKTRLEEEFAARNEEEKERCDAEMAQCEIEKTDLEKEFTGKNVEEKEQCETEKTQMSVEFANQILEKETKCEEARMEVESQTTLESERMETKLQQCESTIVYMGNVMLQNNQGMLEGQRLLESQANTIKEANEEIKRQRAGLLICERAANSTAVQGETIASLRSALASALNFTELLSTKDLEQLQVEQWTKDLMESNIEKKQMIDDLNAILKKGNTIEDSMLEVGEGLANLTSIMESATVNLNIVDQQADVIQKQAKSIAQLTPLLRHTSEGVVWYEKAEAGGSGVESISSCSCLPRSADSNKPTPARIEYHCGDTSNRTFSLPCSGGLCESEALPSCTEPMEWEEESASVTFHHCEETLFNGDTLFCSNAGSNGTREMKITSNTGGGVVEEVNVIHCLDCTDLLTWTAWGPCTSARGETTSGMKCRRKGNDMNGFEEEKKGVVTSPNYPRSYPNNLMKMEKIRVDEGMVLTLQFTAFNTEQCCDKLTIRDENGKTLMESRGGDDLPPNIESRTNVYLDFHTDRDTVRSGWSVNWYARVDA